MMNKKGFSTAGLFVIIGAVLIFIIGLGVIMFASNEINEGLSGVGMVGQVNMTEATAQTWGQFNDGIANAANLMGIMVIFGLFIGLLLSAYFNRGRTPILMFIIDIVLIFFAWIVAGYVSDSYAILLGVSDLNQAFVQNMNLVAKMMLNLPILILIFGVLTMIVTYAAFPESKEEQVAGY